MIAAKQLPKSFVFDKGGFHMHFSGRKDGRYTVVIMRGGTTIFKAKCITREEAMELGMTTPDLLIEFLKEIP